VVLQFTTKDTKGSENEAFDAIVQFYHVAVDQSFDVAACL